MEIWRVDGEMGEVVMEAIHSLFVRLRPGEAAAQVDNERGQEDLTSGSWARSQWPQLAAAVTAGQNRG